MKLSIAQRLALILALTGVLASGLTGYYAYTNSRNLLVAAAEERMRTQANVLIRQVVEAIDSRSRELVM